MKNYLKYFFFGLTFMLVTSISLAQSVGGTTSGATSYCTTTNSGFVSLAGQNGSILNWQLSTNGGLNWINIGNTSPNQTYFNLNQTTCYRAVVKDGAFPADTSTIVCINIYPPTVAGTLSGGGIFCGANASGNLTLTGTIGSILNWEYSINNGVTWIPIANTTNTENIASVTQTRLYRVIAQSGSCPNDTSNIDTVTVTPQTVAGTVLSDTNVCPLLNQFNLNLTGNTGDILYWQYSTDGGITWVTITNSTNILPLAGLLQITLYNAVIQSGNCNVDTTNTVTITVFPISAVNAGNDTTINLGESTILNGTGTGTPTWSPVSELDNGTIFTPLATPSITTTFILTVLDNNGCLNSDTVIVTVNDTSSISTDLTITTLFTPNGDGINDYWYINNIENNADNEVFVYNIYGNLVFSEKGYMNDWDGTFNGNPLPDGTYFYIVKLDPSLEVLKGSLDILR